MQTTRRDFISYKSSSRPTAMDPQGFKALGPCSVPYPHHHHHHHHHHCRHHQQLFLCRHNLLHCHCYCDCHRHGVRPSFAYFPLNPEPASSSPAFVPHDLDVAASGFGEPTDSAAAQVLQEQEHYGIEEEEEDEPVFVLTDEWRDFFAKSEARRKLEKKRATKGKK